MNLSNRFAAQRRRRIDSHFLPQRKSSNIEEKDHVVSWSSNLRYEAAHRFFSSRTVILILVTTLLVLHVTLFHLVSHSDNWTRNAMVDQKPTDSIPFHLPSYLHLSPTPTSSNKQDDEKHQWWKKITGDEGAESFCSNIVRPNVLSGLWQDPNQGRLFARRVGDAVVDSDNGNEEVVNGPQFYVAVHNESYDAVRWGSIFETGKYYEDLVHRRFLDILSPLAEVNDSTQKRQEKSFVIDVGANIGYYSLLSLAMGHNVISFEINPANLMRLCESLRINDFSRAQSTKDGPLISIFQNGVSNTHGTPLQVFVPRNPGQAYMKEIDDGASEPPPIHAAMTSTHRAYTTTVTLDQFAESQGWFEQAVTPIRIPLLKLDVEGKEPNIIAGAKRLLESGLVDNVLTELRRFGRDAVQEALKTLLTSGYVIVLDEGETEKFSDKDTTFTLSATNANLTKLNLAQSVHYLDHLKDELRRSGTNVDLWFQRA